MHVSRLTILLATIVLLAAFATAQNKPRTVDELKPFPNAPLIIVGKSIGDQPLASDKAVGADRDWLKHLRIEIRNVSRKTIVQAFIPLEVGAQGRMPAPLQIPLRYEASSGGEKRI